MLRLERAGVAFVGAVALEPDLELEINVYVEARDQVGLYRVVASYCSVRPWFAHVSTGCSGCCRLHTAASGHTSPHCWDGALGTSRAKLPVAPRALG